jgi:hypothetical protein
MVDLDHSHPVYFLPILLDDVPRDAGFDGKAFTAAYARGGGYQGTGLVEARSTYVAGR